MSDSQRYIRIYTEYYDGSRSDTEVFYRTGNLLKALERFKKDFPQSAEMTITAVEFDLGKADKNGKRAFRAAESAGCVYEMCDRKQNITN